MSEHRSFSRPADPESRSRRGQSLVEFALLLPVLLLLIGGIVQLGVVMATSHTLIQVARDTGRWAATRAFDPCSAAFGATPPEPVTQADKIASESGLMGYTAGQWSGANFTRHPDNTALPPDPPSVPGVEVVWTIVDAPCPPVDNTDEAYVTVRVTHRAPVLLPGLEYLPPLGTCDGSGCHLVITSKAQFRMEPRPAP